MSKESSTKQDSGNRIKVAEKEDSYLEAMSGVETEATESSQQTTCSICGLSARTKEELQDHVSNAHNEASTRE